MRLSSAIHLPYPPYLRTLIVRTTLMWFVVQLLIFATLWLLTHVLYPRPAFLINWEAQVVPTFGVPALVGLIDRKFAHEQLLHENLGVSRLWFWAVCLLTSFTMDGVALAIQARA
jgi:hypothetical protein